MIEGRSSTVIKLTSVLVSFTCVTLVFIPTGGISGVIQGSVGLIICLEGNVTYGAVRLFMLERCSRVFRSIGS